MYQAVVVGGGSGQRMNLGYNKILYKIKGKTIIEYASEKFINDPDFSEVVIVINREDYDQVKLLFDNPKVKVVKGGETRQDSVFIGLNSLIKDNNVFIHDGARPGLSQRSIDLLKAKIQDKACALYTRPKDSVLLHKSGLVSDYLDRTNVGLIRTPQVFKLTEILDAYKQAINHKHIYKDDASLYMSELKKDVVLIEDEELNFKLTTPFDLKVMEDLLW